MKAYVYSETEIPTPDYTCGINSVSTLMRLIEFSPDSDTVAFSIQDLKKIFGINPETEIDLALK